MTSPTLLFTVFYILVSLCFVFPSNEFVSAGFTVQNLLGNVLGSEHENFVLYHIRRTVATILIHSLLPLGYLAGLCFLGYSDPGDILYDSGVIWKLFVAVAVILPLLTGAAMYLWWKDNWKMHPIVKTLTLYANANSTWETVASDINIEFRRIDKFCLDTSSMVKVIVTDSWVMKVTPYTVRLANQDDTALILVSSDTHHMSPAGPGAVQFLNIEVKPTRAGTCPFTIRLDALDLHDLQDKLRRPVVALQQVRFHPTVVDRFLEAFREQVADNPHFPCSDDPESCIGCMQVQADVKLQHCCADAVPGEERCGSCRCRPMWCVDCLGRWFASRQDPERTDTWMARKCTCPMCRERFCVLDVCYVERL